MNRIEPDQRHARTVKIWVHRRGLVMYGRGDIPEDAFPVFSVGTIREARRLLSTACVSDDNGEFRFNWGAHYLPELDRFSDQLLTLYSKGENNHGL